MSSPSVPRNPSNASRKNVSIPRSIMPTPLHEKKILTDCSIRQSRLHPKPGHPFGAPFVNRPIKVRSRQQSCCQGSEREIRTMSIFLPDTPDGVSGSEAFRHAFTDPKRNEFVHFHKQTRTGQ